MSVEELELQRQAIARKERIKIIVGIIIIAAAIFLGLTTGLFPLVAIVPIIVIIVFSFIGQKEIKQYMVNFKNTFVRRSLESVFTDLFYDPMVDKNLETMKRYKDIYNAIDQTNMMDMGDRFNTNDYVSGKYKNINVEQADVHIEEERTTTDSDGNTTTYWETIFLGKWMIFDFNKSFKANIQVCQKGFGNNIIGGWFSKNKFHKVDMEDQDFNNRFRVYSQNEHEAFYILTPSLMERIKRVSNSLKGRILLCFVDNRLHVGLYNNKDSFEASIWKKIDEQKILEEISKDIKIITNFVDELNLDNDLFRKEA